MLQELQLVTEWKNIDINHVKKMVEESEKKRHELDGNRIRALYGHSVPMKIVKEKAISPKKLYHGMAHIFLSEIETDGLLPMSRQYVHLSEDI